MCCLGWAHTLGQSNRVKHTENSARQDINNTQLSTNFIVIFPDSERTGEWNFILYRQRCKQILTHRQKIPIYEQKSAPTRTVQDMTVQTTVTQNFSTHNNATAGWGSSLVDGKVPVCRLHWGMLCKVTKLFKVSVLTRHNVHFTLHRLHWSVCCTLFTMAVHMRRNVITWEVIHIAIIIIYCSTSVQCTDVTCINK